MTQPPTPSDLPRRQAPDTGSYARALADATNIRPLVDARGRTYAWILEPSRNTWPTWHENRPAPTPGCGCAPCQRPFCCRTWCVPVNISTGETVAWLCVHCDTSTPDVNWIQLTDHAPRRTGCTHGRGICEHCLDGVDLL